MKGGDCNCYTFLKIISKFRCLGYKGRCTKGILVYTWESGPALIFHEATVLFDSSHFCWEHYKIKEKEKKKKKKDIAHRSVLLRFTWRPPTKAMVLNHISVTPSWISQGMSGCMSTHTPASTSSLFLSIFLKVSCVPFQLWMRKRRKQLACKFNFNLQIKNGLCKMTLKLAPNFYFNF